MRLLPQSATMMFPLESTATPVGALNCPLPSPCEPNLKRNSPSALYTWWGKGLGTRDLTSGRGQGFGGWGEFSDLQLSPEILPRDHTLYPTAQMILPWGSGTSHFSILTLPPGREDHSSFLLLSLGLSQVCLSHTYFCTCLKVWVLSVLI